jgi:hypothetical protein
MTEKAETQNYWRPGGRAARAPLADQNYDLRMQGTIYGWAEFE